MSIPPKNSLKTGLSADEAGHILGIDYGQADVGLALADTETRMAFASGKLKNDKNLIQEIAKIITREKVKTVVVGIPSYVNRKEVEYEGEKFGKILLQAFPGIAVEYQDEMFTTKMAQQNLIAQGRKGIKAHDDEEAARIILQEWIDRN